MYKIGFIGGGNMASALIQGILRKKMTDSIAVCDRDQAKLTAFEEAGLFVCSDPAFIALNCEYIVLAVKPQDFVAVAEIIRACDGVKKTIISVLAGITIEQLKRELPNFSAFARAMPNLGAFVSQSMTGITFSGASSIKQKYITRIFEAAGKVIAVAEEMINAVTAISGSGPAYVYYFIGSLADSAAALGFSTADARLLAVQTFKGAVSLLESSDEDIVSMIDKVCSKGGTTIAAVTTLRNEQMDSRFHNAVLAAFSRANEMSQPNPTSSTVAPVETGIVVYTDGACSNNPGPGGWAAVLLYNGHQKEISGFADNTTNNHMELLAVINALKALKKPSKLKLYSDSTYVVNSVNNGWLDKWRQSNYLRKSESIPNVELWKDLHALLSKHSVTFIKVKGHSDNKYNDLCDKLAKAQIMQNIKA